MVEHRATHSLLLQDLLLLGGNPPNMVELVTERGTMASMALRMKPKLTLAEALEVDATGDPQKTKRDGSVLGHFSSLPENQRV